MIDVRTERGRADMRHALESSTPPRAQTLVRWCLELLELYGVYDRRLVELAERAERRGRNFDVFDRAVQGDVLACRGCGALVVHPNRCGCPPAGSAR